jgi:serine/threonine protein phosphatase PrpC
MSAFNDDANIFETVVVGEEPQKQFSDGISFINGATRALGKGQDFVAFGKGAGFDWGILLDGHGNDSYINLMRRQNWQSIMTTENPWQTLHELMQSVDFANSKQSGCTLLMLRAYSDRVETLSVGDSGLTIYKNGAMVYKSTEHNSKNKSEVERLKSRNVHFMESYKVPFMVSTNSMHMKKPDYTVFENGDIIAPTQTLGHCNITGYSPEIHTEYFARDDDMRCVLYSDGFGDMFLFEAVVEEDRLNDERDILSMTAEELANKAVTRWEQLWKVYYVEDDPEVFAEQAFPTNMRDDVGVLVWDNKKSV